MKKRNIIVLIVMAVLLVGSLLFADTVQFKENSGSRPANIYGRILVWNNQLNSWESFNGEIQIKIYSNQILHVYNHVSVGNGYYALNFGEYEQEVIEIRVYFKGEEHIVSFDPTVNPYNELNIKWWKSRN